MNYSAPFEELRSEKLSLTAVRSVNVATTTLQADSTAHPAAAIVDSEVDSSAQNSSTSPSCPHNSTTVDVAAQSHSNNYALNLEAQSSHSPNNNNGQPQLKQKKSKSLSLSKVPEPPKDPTSSSAASAAKERRGRLSSTSTSKKRRMRLMGCVMGNSGGALGEEEREQRKVNKQIDEQLQKEKQVLRATHRLLLLGAGESGKHFR